MQSRKTQKHSDSRLGLSTRTSSDWSGLLFCRIIEIAMASKISTSLRFQRRFVSEIELEQVTGISRRTWQKHRLMDEAPPYYKIHGSVRYDLDEVVAWIKNAAVVRSEHTATREVLV